MGERRGKEKDRDRRERGREGKSVTDDSRSSSWTPTATLPSPSLGVHSPRPRALSRGEPEYSGLGGWGSGEAMPAMPGPNGWPHRNMGTTRSARLKACLCLFSWRMGMITGSSTSELSGDPRSKAMGVV